jgi:hypothetical protein
MTHIAATKNNARYGSMSGNDANAVSQLYCGRNKIRKAIK